MKQLLAVIALLTTAQFSNAQITVDNTQSPADLVQNVLLGFGVTESNITVNGSPVTAQSPQGNCTFFDENGTRRLEYRT